MSQPDQPPTPQDAAMAELRDATEAEHRRYCANRQPSEF